MKQKTLFNVLAIFGIVLTIGIPAVGTPMLYFRHNALEKRTLETTYDESRTSYPESVTCDLKNVLEDNPGCEVRITVIVPPGGVPVKRNE